MHDRRGRTALRAATRLLAVTVLVAACTSTPSPAASTTPPTAPPTMVASPSIAPTIAAPSVAPSPTEPPATGVAGAPPCEPADLKASHGLVEGGAGSRFTTVLLVAGVACSVDVYPAFGLRDANGAALVNAVAGGPGRIELDPDRSYQSNVQLSNWCADDPAFPLRFELLVGGEQEEVTGATSFPEEGDLPPCNGDAVRRVFEASPWEAAP